MFGVVPKVFWQKCCEADELNRISLSLTCLLIQAQGKNILVDTGLGSKEDDKFQRMFAVERAPTLLDSLKHLGLGREDIHHGDQHPSSFRSCGREHDERRGRDHHAHLSQRAVLRSAW